MPGDVAWLREHHAKFSTDAEVVDRVVAEATGGRRVVVRERLLRGEINEVYMLTLDDEESLVVRIAHWNPGVFARGEQAIVEARSAGIPVPETIAIETVDVAEPDGRTRQRQFCLQRRLPGRPLDELATRLSGDDLRHLIVQAGEYLGRLHGVARPGGAGRGLWTVQSKEWEAAVYDQAAELGAGRAMIERAFTIADEVRESYEPGASRLVHGDYTIEHLMVDDGAITGVIDWDSAGSGQPVGDIELWDMFCDEPGHPTSLLLEGYQRTAELPEHHELLRVAFGLYHACGLINYSTFVGNRSAAEFAVRRVADFLQKWDELGD